MTRWTLSSTLRGVHSTSPPTTARSLPRRTILPPSAAPPMPALPMAPTNGATPLPLPLQPATTALSLQTSSCLLPKCSRTRNSSRTALRCVSPSLTEPYCATPSMVPFQPLKMAPLAAQAFLTSRKRPSIASAFSRTTCYPAPLSLAPTSIKTRNIRCPSFPSPPTTTISIAKNTVFSRKVPTGAPETDRTPNATGTWTGIAPSTSNS